MTAPAKRRRANVWRHGDGFTASAYPDQGAAVGLWYAMCSCGAAEWDLPDEAAAEDWCGMHVILADVEPRAVSSSSSATEPTLHEALGTEPATRLTPGCAWCGKPIARARTGRPARFDSTSCRQAHHRAAKLPPAAPPTLGSCGLLGRDCSNRHAPVLGHLPSLG